MVGVVAFTVGHRCKAPGVPGPAGRRAPRPRIAESAGDQPWARCPLFLLFGDRIGDRIGDREDKETVAFSVFAGTVDRGSLPCFLSFFFWVYRRSVFRGAASASIPALALALALLIN